MLKKLTELSLLLLVLSLPFANLPLPFSSRLPFQLTEPVFLIVSSLFAVSLLARISRPAGGRIYLFVGAYLIFIALSAVFSESPGRSAVKAAGIAYLAALALLTFNIARDESMIRRVTVTWIAASAAVSAFSLLVLILFYVDREASLVRFGLSHYGTFPRGNYPRIQSFFANPNMLAHYLGIGWVMLLLAREQGWIQNRTSIAAGVLIAIAAVFTLSPGIGVLFFCTGLWILLGNRNGLSRLIAVVLIAVSALFIFSTAVKFDRNFAPTSEASARLLTWSSAASTFAAEPLTGKGVGTGAAAVRYGEQRLTDAHNIFLNVAAESGIGAVAALTLFGIWLTLGGVRFRGPESVPGALAIAFAGAFFYQGMTGSFEDSRHLWVLAGILAAAVSVYGGAAYE
ncbi:MAG: O-antigen ligase family protein [Aridibacter famidurans]|nr:O-antigen ligase family protein [Aridibacter famidurans]